MSFEDVSRLTLTIDRCSKRSSMLPSKLREMDPSPRLRRNSYSGNPAVKFFIEINFAILKILSMNELLVLDNDNKSGWSTEDGLSKIAAEASLTSSHPAFQVSLASRDT